ncbi:MAG: hypothetical protein E6I91_10430 [Chloroflexi bacterium]|nr:MAG: hypothetical protein E6I91_10430 [Chloroflexota bacterium]
MRQRRRTEQDKRRTYPSRIWWQITWSWKSQELSIHQRAWLGVRERDSRQPPSHYNLHVQPACGGPDYHNYHIRYLGAREGEHAWSVIDVLVGREASRRVYTFSQGPFIRETIDVASSSLVTDILNDVGDTSIWLSLVECLALVLFDLYQQDLEAPSRRER